MEDNDELAFKAIRNRYALEGFVKLPEELQSAQHFYKSKDFGFVESVNQKIYELLAE